jgi:dTMP kinase
MPYVVFEGISGAGKSTQVARLAARLDQPLVVQEPTPWFREVRRTLPETAVRDASELALLFADRTINVAPMVCEALDRGRAVISDRSFVSSAVYQANDDPYSAQDIVVLHARLPQPSTIIVLDLDAEVALQRIESRGIARGRNETIELLSLHRQRFVSLTRIFPQLHILSAESGADELHAQVWHAVMADTPHIRG